MTRLSKRIARSVLFLRDLGPQALHATGFYVSDYRQQLPAYFTVDCFSIIDEALDYDKQPRPLFTERASVPPTLAESSETLQTIVEYVVSRINEFRPKLGLSLTRDEREEIADGLRYEL
jgi:hypothetical protein